AGRKATDHANADLGQHPHVPSQELPRVSGHMRLRISPDVTIAMGVRIKRPDEGMRGEDVELILTEQATAFMPPYQRLLSDAMHGIGDLFGRQDIVDAQWPFVNPVFDDWVPPAPSDQARGR